MKCPHCNREGMTTSECLAKTMEQGYKAMAEVNREFAERGFKAIPRSVMQGLRESAAGKACYIGSFAKYAEERRKMITRVELKEKIGSIWAQGNHDAMLPLREAILAEFDRLTEDVLSTKAMIDRCVADKCLFCAKAEALERICEPADLAHSVEELLALADSNEKVYLSPKVKYLIRAVCDYLDSQQKHCPTCGYEYPDSIKQPQDCAVHNRLCPKCGVRGIHVCKPKDEEVLRGILIPTYFPNIERIAYCQISRERLNDLIGDILTHFRLKEGE